MKKKLYRVHATKDVWMVADIEAKDEEEALKLAEEKHEDQDWDENHSQEGDWSYDEVEEI